MIDLPNQNTLDLLVDDATLARTSQTFETFQIKNSSGWLRRYTAFAKSANVGGTLMSDEEFEERKAERQAQENKKKPFLLCDITSKKGFLVKPLFARISP